MKRRGFLGLLLAAPVVPAIAKGEPEIPHTPLMTKNPSPVVGVEFSASGYYDYERHVFIEPDEDAP